MSINLEERFEWVLDAFDFETVHEIMTTLNWTWCGEGVPNIDSMKNSCRDLFESALEDFKGDIVIISTGGFEVTLYKNKTIELKFVLESKEYDPDSDEVY